jgi:hypothetical protein
MILSQAATLLIQQPLKYRWELAWVLKSQPAELTLYNKDSIHSCESESFKRSHPMELYPSQIVYLNHENVTLYAEVIQMAIARPLCWVRPLVLVETLSEPQVDDAAVSTKIYNLKEGSDLLWPATLFHTAMDVEVIPLLANLETEKRIHDIDAIAPTKLRRFIQCVWEAHSSIFEDLNSV